MYKCVCINTYINSVGVTFFIYSYFSTSVHLDTHRSRSLVLAVLFLFHCFTVLPNPFDGYVNCFHFFAITEKTLVNKNLIHTPPCVFLLLLLLFLALEVWFCSKYLTWILPLGPPLWYSQLPFEGGEGMRKIFHNLECQPFARARISENFFSYGLSLESDKFGNLCILIFCVFVVSYPIAVFHKCQYLLTFSPSLF